MACVEKGTNSAQRLMWGSGQTRTLDCAAAVLSAAQSVWRLHLALRNVMWRCLGPGSVAGDGSVRWLAGKRTVSQVLTFLNFTALCLWPYVVGNRESGLFLFSGKKRDKEIAWELISEKRGSKVAATAEKRKNSTAVLGSDRNITDDNSLQWQGRLGFDENVPAQFRKSWAKSYGRSKIDK